MNTISKKQNEMQCLDLLFAQRYLYSSAKKYFGWRTLIALLLAIIGPTVTSQNNSYSAYIGAAAVFYLLFDNLFLERLENSKKEAAAKIQELFDTKVLELPWNDVVVGTKPDIETVALILSRNPDREYSLLKDWYAKDVDRVELSLAKFFCQRSNLWWDTELRKKYLGLLFSALIVIIIFLVILGIFLELTIGKFILGVILPVIPLFEILVKQIKDHIGVATSITKLKEKLDAAIEEMFKNKTGNNHIELSRTFQDEIFRHRKRCPLVFDWVYWFLRNDQEAQMQFSIKNKVDEYLKLKN